MKSYYEDLWERLPPDLEPPDFELRRRFLRDHIRPGDHALDLGCGDGRFTGLLAEAGAQPVGADVALAALRRARTACPDIEFVLTPIDAALPLEDGAFDVVWASEVIEHVADTARWLSEVRRVLRPQGRLLLTTPNHPRLAIALGGLERYANPLSDHLHLYTRRSLRRLLEEFHFGHIALRAAGGPPLMRRLLLASSMR
ncbi:MAG: class I SAM-dependent methyltransferase [Solirubrobacteraceae bacterium]